MTLRLSTPMKTTLTAALARAMRTPDGATVYQVDSYRAHRTVAALQRRGLVVMEARTVLDGNGKAHQATTSWLTAEGVTVAQRLTGTPQEEAHDAMFLDADRQFRHADRSHGAYMSAMDNADQTAREEGFGRYTERWYAVVNSSYASLVDDGEFTEPGQEEAQEAPQEVTAADLDAREADAVYDARYRRLGRFETIGDVYAAPEVTATLVRLGLAAHDGTGHTLTDAGRTVAEAIEEQRAQERAERAAVETAVTDRDRAAGVISDELLDIWERGMHRGHSNAVPVLRPLDPAMRRAVVEEAHVYANTHEGWNFSSAVWEAAKNVPAGRTPGADRAALLMAHDPDGTKAAAVAERGGSFADLLSDAQAAQEAREEAPATVETQERAEDARAAVLARLDAIWSKGYVTGPGLTLEQHRIAAEVIADHYTDGDTRKVFGRDRAALVAEYRNRSTYDVMNAYGAVRLATGGDVWALVGKNRGGERPESLRPLVEEAVAWAGEVAVWSSTMVNAYGEEWKGADVIAPEAVTVFLAQELAKGYTVHRHARGALRVTCDSGAVVTLRPAGALAA